MKRVGISLMLAVSLYSETFELSPVSVVATGEEDPLLKTAAAVSTKEQKEIELDQVVFQKDLFNSLPGVRVEQTGSVFGHMTSIRLPINTGPYYLFMQDGIPVQSSGFFNHNGLAYTTFDTAASVAVLRGAGSALYGSDAVAAVIDVTSAARPTKTLERVFKAKSGMYGFGSGFFQVSGPVNENDGYLANFNYIHSDGWRDHTQADRYEANIRYDKVIDDENMLKFIFNASKTTAQQADSFNNYDNIVNGSSAASDDPAYFEALNLTDVTRRFDYARFSMEWSNFSYEDLEITLTPYLRYNRNRYVATWQPNYPSNDNKLYTFGLLSRNTYTAPFGRIIFGFDSEYTKSSLLYNQDFDITTTGWGAATYVAGPLYDYDVNYYAFAPYVHGDIDLSQQVRLSLGLRYDYNKFDYQNNLAPDSYDASGTYFRPADRTDDFDHLSPKASLTYKIDTKSMVYFRYANGFRIPQASRLYSMKKGQESVTLKPETSNTYEIGYKFYSSKDDFIDVAIYYMSLDDTIVRYKNPDRTYYYANGGSTIHKGIELGSGYRFDPEWKMKLAYSYSRHNYDNDPVYGDNEMRQAPNHVGNLRLFYTPSFLPKLEVMGEFVYVGSWWMDDAHEAGKYKGYKIANLKAKYDYSDRLKFFAKLNNITDKKYAVMANYSYGKENYTPGDPFIAYVGLEYRW